MKQQLMYLKSIKLWIGLVGRTMDLYAKVLEIYFKDCNIFMTEIIMNDTNHFIQFIRLLKIRENIFFRARY